MIESLLEGLEEGVEINLAFVYDDGFIEMSIDFCCLLETTGRVFKPHISQCLC